MENELRYAVIKSRVGTGYYVPMSVNLVSASDEVIDRDLSFSEATEMCEEHNATLLGSSKRTEHKQGIEKTVK